MINQKEITLGQRRKGFHLITSMIVKEIGNLPEKGILNVFIKHTSASLAVNENADPSVRSDLIQFVNKMIPENDHIKSLIFGQSISIPITDHKLNLGIWQGIYLCEFRNNGGNRNIVITVIS